MTEQALVREYHVGDGWQFQCKSCGLRVSCDKAAPATCPGCGRGGWWYRCTTGDSFDGGDWMFDVNDLRKRCAHDGDSVSRHNGIMLPLDDRVEPLEQPFLRGTENHQRRGRGQPPKITPELLKPFVERGLGCKLIARELATQGLRVAPMTLSRHLACYPLPYHAPKKHDN